MTRHFPVNPREFFPWIVFISLVVHFIVFITVDISFPDKTNKNLPDFAFLGSILTDHDFTPGQKQQSAVTRLQTLPDNITSSSTPLSDERDIFKPGYSQQIRTGNKTDYKPELDVVNPKETQKGEKDSKLLGIDLEPPPRPTLKLYRQ